MGKTEPDIEDLSKLEAEATPGPWHREMLELAPRWPHDARRRQRDPRRLHRARYRRVSRFKAILAVLPAPPNPQPEEP